MGKSPVNAEFMGRFTGEKAPDLTKRRKNSIVVKHEKIL